MHFGKGRLILTGQCDAGGAVSFITDDEVKFRKSVFHDFLLSTGDHLNGLVGGEYNCHSRLSVFLEFSELP